MKTNTDSRVGRSLALPVHGLVFIGLAVVTSFFAYLWGATSPNPAELLAPCLFWYAVALLLFAYPLREGFQLFRVYIRTAVGAGVFALYLAIHILLYGFMLESILVSAFDKPFVSGSANVYLTTSVFAPTSLANALWGLWFNPWITITIPPLFSDALSFYSLTIAIVIAILIVANIGKTRELGRVCSATLRSRSMVLFPALGIVLGASCCLSVPVLIVLAGPGVAALSSSLWLYDATYLPLPTRSCHAPVSQPLLRRQDYGQRKAFDRWEKRGSPQRRFVTTTAVPDGVSEIKGKWSCSMNRMSWALTILTILGVLASTAVLVDGVRASQGAAASLPAVNLPPGCVKPAGGYLILASQYGYNDSVLEGAGPSKLWPVIYVAMGQDVKITVCNVDTTQSHGFQVSNYFDNSIESLAPGKVLTVSFVATKEGNFPIYCAIFCSIHLFMDYGMLRVTS